MVKGDPEKGIFGEGRGDIYIYINRYVMYIYIYIYDVYVHDARIYKRMFAYPLILPKGTQARNMMRSAACGRRPLEYIYICVFIHIYV